MKKPSVEGTPRALVSQSDAVGLSAPRTPEPESGSALRGGFPDPGDGVDDKKGTGVSFLAVHAVTLRLTQGGAPDSESAYL